MLTPVSHRKRYQSSKKQQQGNAGAVISTEVHVTPALHTGLSERRWAPGFHLAMVAAPAKAEGPDLTPVVCAETA